MLRELATVLHELRDGLADASRLGAAGLSLSAVEMTLPMDIVPILRDGGCVLLADVPRTRADADWRDRPSRLRVLWQARPGTGNEATGEEKA